MSLQCWLCSLFPPHFRQFLIEGIPFTVSVPILRSFFHQLRTVDVQLEAAGATLSWATYLSTCLLERKPTPWSCLITSCDTCNNSWTFSRGLPFVTSATDNFSRPTISGPRVSFPLLHGSVVTANVCEYQWRPAFLNKRLTFGASRTSSLQVLSRTDSQDSRATWFSPPHLTITLHYPRFFFKRGRRLEHIPSISLPTLPVALIMPPGIYRLPLELIREVAAESSSRDLATLALTCRHFHAWVNPYLYERNLKHEKADAAVWAAAHGRLDTLLLLHGSQSRLSKSFIKKVWCGRARYGKFLPLPQPVRSPLRFTLLHLAAQG